MLLCRAFQSLVLVTCLCLSLPSQHSPARASRNRMWDQCLWGSKPQAWALLRACIACRHHSEEAHIPGKMLVVPLPHHCEGITPQPSSKEESTNMACPAMGTSGPDLQVDFAP